MRSNRGVLCLMFTVCERKLDNVLQSKQSKVEGYALLPHISHNSKVFKVFKKNDIHIISKDLDCSPLYEALIDNQVEVIQVLLEDASETKSCKSQTSSSLKYCVEKGNRKVIDLLLGNDALFHKTNLNFSGFHRTVDGKNLNLIESLLQYNPNITFRHPAGGTLLHLAVIRGHKPLVRLLLDCSADVDAKRRNLSTPLHLAALKGNLQIVKLLLKHGASVSAKRSDGSTCLHIAAFRGRVQVHKLLLQHGARAQARRYDGSTALHSAAKKGHVKIVKDLLQEGVSVNSTITTNSPSTPMYFAIQKGHAKVVHLLLKHGVNVNTRFGGLTILEQAVSKGRADVVETVVNHRPDLNNKNNRKALCQAVTLADGKEIVEKLLQYGFSLDAECKNDPSLLHEAVRKNYLEIVSQLLDHGASINELHYSRADCDKYAPLHTAARYSNENMIRLLLDRGADICVLSGYKKEPINIAVYHSNEKAVEVFIEKGVDVRKYRTLFSAAVENGSTAIVEMLAQNGADIHSNYPFDAPLVIAARRGYFEMVKVLLQLGAKVDSGSRGKTALHVVSRLDIIEYLIQNGANVNARCHDGTTPLLNAASDGKCNIIETFLKFGADMHITDHEGRSVLQEAGTWGDPKPMQLLLDYGFPDLTLLTDTLICCDFDPDRIHVFDEAPAPMHFYHIEKENFKKAAAILTKHMIKMDSAGLYYGEENQMPTWYCEEISMTDYQKNCEAEVASLRSTKVANSNVSYFDILVSNVHQLTCFARNDEIVCALKSSGLSTRFPLYANILTCQLQKGIHRREFLDQGIKVCLFLFRFFRELPRFLKEKILNYLSNQDIKILVGACIHSSV